MTAMPSRLAAAALDPFTAPRCWHSRVLRRGVVLALAGLAGASACAVPITEFHAYRIDPALGPSIVNSIASNDLMTGQDATSHGYVMRVHKPAQPIPLPPGYLNVIGYSINASGQVTGIGELRVKGRIRLHAFFADLKKGTAVDVPPLTGKDNHARGINASGQIVGDTPTRTSYRHAFIADAKGHHLRDLGTLSDPSAWSYAVAINSRGEVAGTSPNADFAKRAFLSGPDGGALVDLGVPPDGVESEATGMNELGVVVGSWTKADGLGRGFITGPDGASITDIGQLDGQATTPLAVNADGNVVGEAFVSDNVVHAVITGDAGVGFVDLNTVTQGLHTQLVTAGAINDLGHVVALGKDGYSYLLCPTLHCR